MENYTSPEKSFQASTVDHKIILLKYIFYKKIVQKNYLHIKKMKKELSLYIYLYIIFI